MNAPQRPRRQSPMGEAMMWTSRIMSFGMAMFLPAVIGGWLDDRMGTEILGAIGLVFGFIVGLTWLVRTTVGKH